MQKLVGMVIVSLVLAAAALPTNARQGIRQGRSNLPAPPVTQQLLFITQYSPLETVGGAGSANRVIFRFVPGMWPPEPPYSGGGFALSGGDAGLFHVDPNSGLLSIGSTDVAARGTPYQFNVTVNGTHVTPVGVLVRPAGTAWIEVDNWNPIAGSSITATVHDSPNPPGQPGGGDIIAVDWATGIRSAYWPSNSPHLPPGSHELTHTFFLPDSGGDEISYLRVLQFTENVGGVQTGPIVLRPTAPVTPAPTAPNTLSDPFVPLHTYTVCLGGTCDFAEWADALRAASGQDYVKIVIGQGAYVNCYAPNVTAESNMPHHLWIKGPAATFPFSDGVFARIRQRSSGDLATLPAMGRLCISTMSELPTRHVAAPVMAVAFVRMGPETSTFATFSLPRPAWDSYRVSCQGTSRSRTRGLPAMV